MEAWDIETPAVSEDELLSVCETAIERGDADLLLQLLEAFDFEDMKLSEARSLFYYLIVACLNNGRGELVPEIANYLGSVLAQGTGIETFLFSEPSAQQDALNFYYKHNRRDWAYYITSLYSLPEEPDVQQAFANITNLEEVRTTVTYEQCQELLRRLYSLPEDETPQGEVIEELLKSLAATVAPTVKKPSYILDTRKFYFEQLKTGTWTTPVKDGYFLEIPTHEELLRLLPVPPENLGPQTDKSMSRGEKIRQIAQSNAQEAYEAGEIEMNEVPFRAQKIEASVEFMDYEEYQEFFATYERKVWEKSLQDDVHVFRILGPCHPRNGPYELDSTSDDPCLRHGGCRMFTCVECEFEDDEEDLRFTNPELVEWFTGECDRCAQIITEKHYGTRVCLEYGRIKGCYCSTKHAIRDCIDNGIPVARLLTEKAAEQLLTTGIYDRVWPRDEPTRESLLQQIERGQELITYLKETKPLLPITEYPEIDIEPIVIS